MLEKFVEEEFNELSREYNPDAKVKKCVLKFDNRRFFESFRETIINNRRGEVGFLLKRKNGKYVLVRSKKYPADLLRIPTGGIEFNETAKEALYREVKEELGVEGRIIAPLGVTNHILKEEKTHFVAPRFLVEILEEPENKEPKKVNGLHPSLAASNIDETIKAKSNAITLIPIVLPIVI